MSLLDSLNRLQRAGDEGSKATAKLHEAASDVARKIREIAPEGVRLPRGYMVLRVRSNISSTTRLVKETGEKDQWGESQLLWIDGDGTYLHGDFNAEIPAQTRAGSLAFAKDIAEGLLDEIAAFLEAEAAKDVAATSALEAAAE
jgi:hypothetical protein